MSLSHRIPGLILTDHEFRVPLDHAEADGAQITVFARAVVATEHEGDDLPWLLYLQGGPGRGAPRPMANGGWIKCATQEFRLLLLDQRGTGRSTPVTHQTLARLHSAQEQADYLKHFRADNIVRDCEQIRRELVGENAPWSALGQSFGGFCLAHYLSAAPDGLREALFTGGLPPLERPADHVYRATYRRVREQNRHFYARYPQDEALAQEIADFLHTHEVRLPGGDPLSVRRFQQLGMGFGASDGFQQLHYLLENAFVEGPSQHELSYKFLRGVENALTFEIDPIFAILHEAIYCQYEASRWSAQRVRGEYPEFDWAPGRALLFTGEMIYPWMFEEYGNLRPLKAAAEILAGYAGWPRLYDAAKLRANRVPCAAAIYYDDMYVEREFSEETAKQINGIRLWITNEYQHDGLRADGEALLTRLLALARGAA